MDQYGYLDEADGCAAGQRSHRHQLELARAFLETHRGMYNICASVNLYIIRSVLRLENESIFEYTP